MVKLCIDGEWYDLTKWAPHHPGGERILERFADQDATDHFYSLHSKSAIATLKRMRPLDVKEDVPSVDPVDVAFRAFKAELLAEGWWERTLWRELVLLLPIFAMCVTGTLLAWSHPIAAVVIISVAMQQAGWLGHDMIHSRDSAYNNAMRRYVAGWINGFDRNWWSEKHNTHHVLTNHAEHDCDIHVQPLLFLWAPPKSVDHHLRKYQHYYAFVLYCLLYVSWRLESIKCTIRNRDWKMALFTLAPCYVWLACLPLAVTVGSLLLSGFLVAFVVTMSHESEEILLEREPSFAKTQFRGTRDVICPDPVTEYLFGGMQYQLEHHLFPTMPRYNYAALVPRVKAWAEANGIEYKTDRLSVMTREHFKTLKRAGALVARDVADEEDPYRLK